MESEQCPSQSNAWAQGDPAAGRTEKAQSSVGLARDKKREQGKGLRGDLSYQVGGSATLLLYSQKGVQFLLALQKGGFLGVWASRWLQAPPETHIATTAL
jgi:hypothetical protein